MHVPALLLTLSTTLLPTLTNAQFLQFGGNNLPQCAQSCQTLQQAQTLCVPPAAPQVQKPCFCQSALLTQLKGNPDAVCAQNCEAGDRQQIQTWYNSYCQNPNAQVQQTSTAGGDGQPTSTSGSGAAGATSTGRNGNQDIGYTRSNDSWWDTHARWIAMVIVLVIAFAIIIALGIWLRKRHNRRRNASNPLPVGWGPNSNPHTYGDSGAVLVPRDGGEAEKNGAGEVRETTTAAGTVGVSPDLGTAAKEKGTRGGNRISAGKLSKLVGVRR